MTKTGSAAAAATVVLVTTIGISSLFAQEQRRTRLRTPPTQAAAADQVTLSGTLVDLQCYMSGKFVGRSPEACSRNCIRRGVPAALDTGNGLIVLGMAKGPSSKLALQAMRTVEVTGTLHEKHGLRYLEVAAVKRIQGPQSPPEPEDEYGDEPEDEPEQDPEDPPEPDSPDIP